MDPMRKAQAVTKAIPFIENAEGYRFKAYKNSPEEPWTVGFGFTYDEQGNPFTADSTMDRHRAELFLVKQTNLRADQILRDIGNVSITTNELAACISLHHNLGEGQWASSSVLRFIRAGQFKAAADAFLLWKRGNTADDLLPRRQKERALFLS